jgi:hypothetical protein
MQYVSHNFRGLAVGIMLLQAIISVSATEKFMMKSFVLKYD